MVLTITEEEFIRMKMTLADRDEKDALLIVKELVKRIEQQKNLRLRSHLD